MLTDAGQQIAAGDYARRTALHTGDEIETLSASFDKMADAVQEKIADLEADVQKREDFVGAFTHELKTPNDQHHRLRGYPCRDADRPR